MSGWEIIAKVRRLLTSLTKLASAMDSIPTYSWITPMLRLLYYAEGMLLILKSAGLYTVVQ